MSFTDLERGLTTPPLSPNHRDEGSTKRHLGPIITATATMTLTTSDRKSPYSPVSPPIKLPSGMQVARGNSRDSIGLDHKPALQKHSHAHAHAPYPPPVSPKRKSNNSMAQHSRFLDDNTRFDTPRPTLTPSDVVIASDITGVVKPRSPQAVPTAAPATQQGSSSGSNRILGERRPGDQERRQVLSPPTSPRHLSPPTSPMQNQYRGFSRVDNQGPPDSGAAQRPKTNSNSTHDTVIDVTSAISGSPSITVAFSPSAYVPVTAVPVSTSIQDQEHDYDLMVRHVSQQIFNISSNIAVLERLVPCLGQRHKDTAEMRASLHAVLDGTQDLVKSAHGLIKVLAKYHQPTSGSPRSEISIRVQPIQSMSEMSSWERKVMASRRQTHQRLTKDLALVSKAFQELQRQTVEAERRQVATLRRLSSSASLRRLSQHRSDLMDLSQEEIEAGALNLLNGKPIASGKSSSDLGVFHDRELSTQEEALLREILAVDGELVFQESILQERESEIRKVEEGMGQVLDVMRELGTLVHEQRSGVDFLHDNILQTRGRIQLAQQEVLKASEHQRQSREKLCYLIMIASIVGALVMLAFVST
ncbi:t-SNARE [Gamsiella multidivaricata]|uniref:t-SNARE n=1 Tax=Gamsiella multidivaricata TaxID=101098 RepID=UPI00221FFF73|nr:t-SNARE [Gamsiella multidivaricata]KAG0354938.1 hypothetical protein BGZ54_001366 [Gamsiella multidivaricata]KAI7822915.1 t-SNARE [Gamsiella multidivaricata]